MRLLSRARTYLRSSGSDVGQGVAAYVGSVRTAVCCQRAAGARARPAAREPRSASTAAGAMASRIAISCRFLLTQRCVLADLIVRLLIATWLGRQEAEQGLVELASVGVVEAMWCAFDVDQGATGDGRVRAATADLERDDGVGTAVDDQCRDADLAQVAAEVGQGECLGAIQCSLGRGTRGDGGRVPPVGLADDVGPSSG